MYEVRGMVRYDRRIAGGNIPQVNVNTHVGEAPLRLQKPSLVLGSSSSREGKTIYALKRVGHFRSGRRCGVN